MRCRDGSGSFERGELAESWSHAPLTSVMAWFSGVAQAIRKSGAATRPLSKSNPPKNHESGTNVRPREVDMRNVTAILLFAVIQGTAGCGGGSGTSTPTTPSTATPTPTPTPAPVQLAMFADPASTFSTTDVRDVQEQIVRFDTANNALIWAADGRSFPGYPVSGNFMRSDRSFQVRFGTKDGERRAYFTETVATTICDIEVIGGQLVINPTAVRVPGS